MPACVAQDKKLTLRGFAAYSDWAKSVHFSDPSPTGAQEDFAATRRPKTLPNQFASGAGGLGSWLPGWRLPRWCCGGVGCAGDCMVELVC